MTDSTKRVMAAALVAAALTPVLGLSGCASDARPALEGSLAAIEHVEGAFVVETNGAMPGARGLAVRLYLDEDPGDEALSHVIDDALRLAWGYESFVPRAGVRLGVVVGQRPADPPRILLSGQRPIVAAANLLDWPSPVTAASDDSIGLADTVLASRYGERDGD